jgi:MFS family permease
VAGRSLRQVLSPLRLRGRVVSGSRVVGYGMVPVGALLGGWIARSLGLRWTFWIGGGLILVTALILRTWLTETRIATARARTLRGS